MYDIDQPTATARKATPIDETLHPEIAGLVSRALQSRMANASRAPSALRALTYGLILAAGVVAWQQSARADTVVTAPAPAVDEPASDAHSETAVLAGGCFWGVQGVFAHVHGVTRVVAGYAGGSRGTAKYDRVSEGDTGHAESVEITFDPTQVSYGRLLQVFFSVVQDPTMRDAQGPDEGTQYRSAIFPANDAQRRVASLYISQLAQAHVFAAPIATDVEKFRGFYAAEAYHQNYMTAHPDDPYIVHNDLPKVIELHKRFPTLYRADPLVTTDAARHPQASDVDYQGLSFAI